MAVTNMAAVEAGIKEVYYTKTPEDLTALNAPTYNRIKNKAPNELNSRSGSIVIRPRYNGTGTQKAGAAAEFADYPAPGNSPLVKLTVPMSTITKQVWFSHHMLYQNKLDSTLSNEITEVMQNSVDAIMMSENIDLWGDGSAERARVSSVSTLTFTCANAGNLYGVQLLEVGMRLEFRTSGGTLRQAGGESWGEVTAIDYSTPSFTLNKAPTDVANGDRVYLQGSYNGAPRGFLYHFNNTGEYQGLPDRTIYRNTNSIVQAAGGATLSASMIDRMHYARGFKVRNLEIGTGVEYFVSTQGYAYLQTGYGLKVLETKMDGGFTNAIKGLTHGGTPINFDPDVQRDHWWAVDLDGIYRAVTRKTMLVENDAGGFLHILPSQSGTGYRSGRAAMWEGVRNYWTKYPAKCAARISGLSTTNQPLGNDD